MDSMAPPIKSAYMHSSTLSVYLFFAALSVYTARYLSDHDWSALIAVDYMLQALATIQLLVHMLEHGKIKGISVGMLQALAMSYGLRLSSTVWLQGYLPVDQTGTWFCQVMDLTSLVCVVQLLQRVSASPRDSEVVEADKFPMTPLLSGCLVLGLCCHADLDQRPLFDALWTAGFLAGCVAPLPQVVVTLSCEGAPPLPCHFTVPLSLAVVATTAFWRFGCLELEPARTMWCIAGAVMVQVVLALALLLSSTHWARTTAASLGLVTQSDDLTKARLVNV